MEGCKNCEEAMKIIAIYKKCYEDADASCVRLLKSNEELIALVDKSQKMAKESLELMKRQEELYNLRSPL